MDKKLFGDRRGKGGMDMATKFMGGLLIVVILGFILIVVTANLRTSGGLDTGTQEYNDTETALQNVSSGVADFFSNIPTWFSMLSVVIIIILVIAVVTVAKKAGGGGSGEL